MKKITIGIISFFILINITFAGLVPKRTEMLLNGTWNFTPTGQTKTTMAVPEYWDAIPGFENVHQAVYEWNVTVPKTLEWADKIIKLEFEGVNFIADIYINDNLVANHIGAWIPFSVDITNYIKPGETFSLKIDVKGGSFQPIVDENGLPQWPVGFFGQEKRWGIVFDVWLRAYGKTCIEDVFIQTSFRNKKIIVDYQLKNHEPITKVILIYSYVKQYITESQLKLKFKSNKIILKPGEEKKVTIIKSWDEPHLWTPDDPFLYYLESKLVDESNDNNDSTYLDKDIKRFGFREIWTTGNRIIFNGHPITLMGTNIVQHSEFYDNQRYLFMTQESWNSTIDRLQQLNLRTIRFHMQPVPQFILDIADERGLLIIDESGIYAREYVLKANKEVYIDNCKKWISSWIKADRNHPSIIMWNAENEMGIGWLKWMTNQEIKSLGDAIRLSDTTRLVNYDGDGDVGDELINLHYPEQYSNTFHGSIYSWVNLVSSIKPTGVGEFLTHYGENGEEN